MDTSTPVECTLITHAASNTGDYIGGIVLGSLGALLILAILIGYVVTQYYEARDSYWKQRYNDEHTRLMRLPSEAA